MNELHFIDDAATFQLLTHPTRAKLIELFYEAQSVTAVAEQLGVPRTRLYHHISALEDAGILVVAETRQVGAITEKIYQVVAKSFSPSPAFLEQTNPALQAEVVINTLVTPMAADFVNAMGAGAFSFEKQPEQRSLMLERRLMKLSPSQLHDLVTELSGVIERYTDINEPDSEHPTISVASVIYPSAREI